MIKLVIWFDNEYGHFLRMNGILKIVARKPWVLAPILSKTVGAKAPLLTVALINDERK